MIKLTNLEKIYRTNEIETVALENVNMAALDRLDTYRESLGIVRLLATIGVTYLLMAAMIGLGVCFSARKAIRMAPAEALRYE